MLCAFDRQAVTTIIEKHLCYGAKRLAELAKNVGEAPPLQPKNLTQDELLNLFSAEETGADFVLEPATDADMLGKFSKPKESLEVVYENV